MSLLAMVVQKVGGLSHDIGMDLGTGNTLIHVRGHGVVVNEPSVVALGRGGSQVVAIGLEAKRMLGRTNADVDAIRPMKDGVIADIDMAELMIREFIRKASAKRLIRTKPRMVIGVPSGITDLERRAVRSAAFAAGAREVHLLAEPMAAAIGAGLPVSAPTASMVVDIGGGSTEIAVISLGGIVSDSSIRVAGDRLDHDIASYVRRKYNLLIGDATAEHVKMEIGSAWPVDGLASMEVRGRDVVTGIPRTVVVSPEDVREATSEAISQIVDATLAALETTPPELAGDIVERGITMTGGGALIRGLGHRIGERTGLPVQIDEDPLTSVVRGTAMVLEDSPGLQALLAA
ncbi:MAG TPA: rod shape-determining protein [Longimicrobiales bacterium]|nr:rod shape-determining protein [Longimicrobiales bacterium]